MVEAAAAGCPVVMTDVGVAGEIIRDGETGRVVKVKDVSGLVESLKRAMEKSEEMERMVEKAQEEVLSLPPRTREEYLECYKASLLCA